MSSPRDTLSTPSSHHVVIDILKTKRLSPRVSMNNFPSDLIKYIGLFLSDDAKSLASLASINKACASVMQPLITLLNQYHIYFSHQKFQPVNFSDVVEEHFNTQIMDISETIKNTFITIQNRPVVDQIQLCKRILDKHGHEGSEIKTDSTVERTPDYFIQKAEIYFDALFSQIKVGTLKSLDNPRADKLFIPQVTQHVLSQVRERLYRLCIKKHSPYTPCSTKLITLSDPMKHFREAEELWTQKSRTTRFTSITAILFGILNLAVVFSDNYMREDASFKGIVHGVGGAALVFYGCFAYCNSYMAKTITGFRMDHQVSANQYQFFQNTIENTVFPSESKRSLYIRPSFTSLKDCHKNSYVIDEKALYYVHDDDSVETVPLTYFHAFQSRIKALRKSNETVIELTGKQIYEIITLNGGHIPPEMSKTTEFKRLA